MMLPKRTDLAKITNRQKTQPRTSELQKELLGRLSRAEGQLRGIKRMLDENVYCIDILQQISAVRRALDKIALLLLRDHLETCVRAAMAQRDSHDKVDELIEALDRFLG